MAKHIHIHLHDETLKMPLSKVLQKVRNGEWEAENDVVPNRTLPFKNTRTGRKFFVQVEHDAGFSNSEYNPREVARLKDQLKRYEAQLADLSSSYSPAASKLRENLKQEIARVKAEMKQYRDAATLKYIEMKSSQFQMVQAGKKYKVDNELVEILKKVGYVQGYGNPLVYVKVITNTEGIIDAESPEIDALKSQIEKLENEQESKRDKGVTVTPADMKKLQDLRDKLKKLTS